MFDLRDLQCILLEASFYIGNSLSQIVGKINHNMDLKINNKSVSVQDSICLGSLSSKIRETIFDPNIG